MTETTAEVHIFRLTDAVSGSLLQIASNESSEILSLQSALRRIGILVAGQDLLSYRDISPWRRGGAETYISDFCITFSADSKVHDIHVIAKAMVRWGLPPEQTVAEWLTRQSRLERFGAGTARTLGISEGVLYQQFIPFCFKEWFEATDSDTQNNVVAALLELATRVDAAGFTPTEFVDSVRTDGSVLYVVDFGADLGGFQDQPGGGAACDLVYKWLEKRFP